MRPREVRFNINTQRRSRIKRVPSPPLPPLPIPAPVAPPPYSACIPPEPRLQGGNINLCAAVERVIDTAAKATGGHDYIDAKIRTCFPAVYLFCTQTPIREFTLTNRPSKFVIIICTLAALQTLVNLDILDTLSQALFAAFTWYSLPHVRPVPILLTHIALLPRYIPAFGESITVPSLWMLLLSFALTACPANLPHPTPRGTVIETYACPYVKPLAHRIRSLNIAGAKEYLQDLHDSDPYALAKVGVVAAGLLLFSSLMTHVLAELVFRITWLALAIKSVLVLDELRRCTPDSSGNATAVLRVWSFRLLLHGLETAYLPLVGRAGSEIIPFLPVYFALASVGILVLLFWDDIRDIREATAKALLEHQLHLDQLRSP